MCDDSTRASIRKSLTIGKAESKIVKNSVTLCMDDPLHDFDVKMGKVINVENLNVDTRFVGNFFQANEGLVTKNSGPLRAREGDCRGPLRAREGDCRGPLWAREGDCRGPLRAREGDCWGPLWAREGDRKVRLG